MPQNPTISEGIPVPRLNNQGPTPTVLAGVLDPIQDGLRADQGSFYVRQVNPPQVYEKIGKGNFDWDLVIGGGTLPVYSAQFQGIAGPFPTRVRAAIPVQIQAGDKLLIELTVKAKELTSSPNAELNIFASRFGSLFSGATQYRFGINPLQTKSTAVQQVIDNPLTGVQEYGFSITGSGTAFDVDAVLTTTIIR